jgi:hypothetical protein
MPVEQLLGKDGQPLALAQRAIATVISDLARLGLGQLNAPSEGTPGECNGHVRARPPYR